MADGWPSFAANSADFCNGNAVETSAASGIEPTPPPAKKTRKRYVRLENSPQIRREMARVYRGLEAGEIDLLKGGKLVYVLTEISRTLERESVEKLNSRLDEVEGK
ncbi:hypothetical protein [Altererythrobacter aquiaggeris]|uniref:hypothetical protein n=1 Tax=Aestuarierythrobacter aquiaggeris TaxID=1898396 RepID=UPI003016B421